MGADAGAAVADGAGTPASFSELESNAAGPATAASAAAADAAGPRRRRRALPRPSPPAAAVGAVAVGVRDGPGRGGAGVEVVDWTLAQASRSLRRATWRAVAASTDSRRGRCILPRTPGRPVDRSEVVKRPKTAQKRPASPGWQPCAAADRKASSARAAASESFSPALRAG